MWDPAIPGTCWSQKIEVGIGQLQGGEQIAVGKLQLFRIVRADNAHRDFGVPRPSPLRFTYILYVEDTD